MTSFSRAPDLIAHNGKVITVDDNFTVSDAVAVRGDRIIAIGGGAEMIAAADAETRVVDLAGKSVIPGLFDGHAHLDREGLKEQFVSLGGARSIDDILAVIARLVADAAPGEWIVTMPLGDPPGYRGMPGLLSEGRFPNRHDLDSVAPDNPVYIRPIWGYWRHHDGEPLVSVANSRALELAGVTRDTSPPIASVVIDKDPSTGEPTGIFYEDTLGPIVEFTFMQAAGRFAHEDRVRGLERSMQAYLSFGTTSVFDGHGTAGEVLAAYQALDARNDLQVRADLLMSPAWDAVAGVDRSALFDTWGHWLQGSGLGNDYLRMAGLFLQIGAETGINSMGEARLKTPHSPYTGWSSYNYDHLLPKDEIVEMMVTAARRDIRIGVITLPMLDCLEKANAIEPIVDRRWVLGHMGVLSEEQVHKIRDLGLVVTTHTNSYIHRIASELKAKLGPERENDIAPLKRLRDAGVRFCLATDNQPISLWGPIWQTIARQDGETGEIVAPDQALSREEALRAATIDGAYLCRDEASRGSLEVGKLADFVVLDNDPLTGPDDQIVNIQAETAVVGGQVVYERSA